MNVGGVPNYKHVPEGECLTGQAEYSRSCVNVWGSGLATKSSMMKSSTIFECGPLPPMSTWHPPDIMHMISVPKTFLLPFYCFHFLLNANRRAKTGEAWEQGTSGCYWGLSKVLAQMTKHSFLRISALLLPILSADKTPA